MGINVYYYIVAATIVFGVLMPQTGQKRKQYIILMALIHTFFCAFRYEYLTGDLQKYAATFLWHVKDSFMSQEVFHEGRNFGFYWFLKVIYLTGADFQWVLILIAVISEICLAVLVYHFSPRPWLSYLMWNCIGFYVFGFSALKQALAMALLFPACDAMLSDKKGKFLIWTLLAGAVHAPALVFLPAYWITHYELKGSWILLAATTIIIIVFRAQVVDLITPFYYEDEGLIELSFGSGSLGTRFFVMLLLLIMGLFIKGLSGRVFRKVFKLMVVAAVLQSFSGFNNVFTRLADYYFQFSVLYVPMLFFDFEKHGTDGQIIKVSREMLAFVMVILAAFSVWYYSNTTLHYTAKADDYTNYRFFWDEDNPYKRSIIEKEGVSSYDFEETKNT